MIKPPKLYALIAGVACLFSLIAVSLTWINLCCKFRFQRKKVRKEYKNLVYIFFISVLICLIAAIIHYGSCYIYGYDLLEDKQVIAISIYFTDSFYFISSLLIYILLLSKVYFTFKGTVYAIKTCSLCIVTGLILIIAGLMFIWVLIFAIFWTKVDSDLSMMSIVIIIFDFTLNVFMSVLFISKLRQLYESTLNYNKNESTIVTRSVKSAFKNSSDYHMGSKILDVSLTNQHDHGNHRNTINVSSPKESLPHDPSTLKRKKSLLNLMTKQLLLGILASIANQFYNLSNAILFLIPPKTDMDVQRNEAIFSGCMAFEHIMNSLIIYWTFKINNKIYMKMCGCCHNIILRCFIID